MTGFRRGHTRAAKLTPSQVLEIREKWNEGQTQASLAREYQMSEVQIGRICRGTSWQDYHRPPHPGEIEHSKAVLTMGTADPIDMDPETKARLAVELAADMAASKAGAAASPLDSLPPALAAKAAFYTSGAKPGLQTTEETHRATDTQRDPAPAGRVDPGNPHGGAEEQAHGHQHPDTGSADVATAEDKGEPG